MLILDLVNCGPSAILKIVLFFKKLIEIAFIVVPIALIVFMIFDIMKSIMYNGDIKIKKSEDLDYEMSKGIRLAVKRLLNAVILFFVPTITSIAMGMLGNAGLEGLSCYSDINKEAILVIERAEEEAKEIEEVALREALKERIALEQEEEAKKETATRVYTAITSNNKGTILKAEGCDGAIYYENGIFYRPDNIKNGTEETKGSAPYNYNKYFYEMLDAFVQAGKSNGATIIIGASRSKAWRPYEYQVYFACCDGNFHAGVPIPYRLEETGQVCNGPLTCNSGSTAATPGYSNHGWGIASDLSYANQSSKDWAHANAEKYGLNFSVCANYFAHICKEDWHIDPISVVVDNEKVKQCLQ